MKQLNLTHEEYMKLDALSNSSLQLIADSVSNYVWNKEAPVDTTKSTALDFGSAFHTAMLEPEKFNGSYTIYSETKSRDTVKFQDFLDERDDPKEIILFEHEYDKIRLMVDSAKAHPAFNQRLIQCQEREKSIVGDFMGVKVKIRPDLKCDDHGLLCELKSTDNLDDWRDSAIWKNPLFKFNYGHGAAMYMDVYQSFLGRPVNEYTFLVSQKKIEKGRYPVAAITITREELTRYGFFDDFYNNIEKYKERSNSGDWVEFEKMPLFKVQEYETVEISEVD